MSWQLYVLFATVATAINILQRKIMLLTLFYLLMWTFLRVRNAPRANAYRYWAWWIYSKRLKCSWTAIASVYILSLLIYTHHRCLFTVGSFVVERWSVAGFWDGKEYYNHTDRVSYNGDQVYQYCQWGLKWHSSLFGNICRLVRVFAVI